MAAPDLITTKGNCNGQQRERQQVGRYRFLWASHDCLYCAETMQGNHLALVVGVGSYLDATYGHFDNSILYRRRCSHRVCIRAFRQQKTATVTTKGER